MTPNKQITTIAYADGACENCGKDISKGGYLIIEEDLIFCSEECADVFFERMEDEESPAQQVSRENAQAAERETRDQDSIRESDEAERRNH